MKNRVFKALIRKNLIRREDVDDIRALEKETGQSFDKILREKDYVSEEALLKVFHKVTSFPFRKDLSAVRVPPEFTARVTAQQARSFNMVAILYEDGVFHVATNEPLNLHAMDQLGSLLEAETEPVLAPKAEITALLNNAFSASVAGVNDIIDGMDEDEGLVNLDNDNDGEDLLDQDKGPIPRMVNSIIFGAFRSRASDIHFQPYEDRLVVRGRIDGILHEQQTIPKSLQDAVLTRCKVMSKMDIAERRLPQDGRASVRIGDAEVDIRFNSVPTNYGERIVLRLLDKTEKVYELDDIGLSEEDKKLIEQLLGYQHGIILVTGPTGSGKTTTLYASLSRIDHAKKNVITIEDPIEYHLAGISQIQVSAKKGLTFDKGLRALLRQDPDVMMVGEIRDGETAKIAIQAALTGHLVFSTLHTNDAASSVTRLLDIGVEPYLVASSVICIIAQRLVRLICDRCSYEYEPSVEELAQIGLTPRDLPNGTVAMGMGCNNCFEGYRGRTAIYEILTITDGIKEQILKRSGASMIKEAAQADGLKTLRSDGARKVMEGKTTIEEVLRVTQLDVN